MSELNDIIHQKNLTDVHRIFDSNTKKCTLYSAAFYWKLLRNRAHPETQKQPLVNTERKLK